MNRTEEILLSVFVAVESAHAFSAFNPSIFTIHRFRDQYTTNDIIKGCLLASTFSIVVGGLTSKLAKTPLPLILSIAVAGGMSMVYLAATKGVI